MNTMKRITLEEEMEKNPQLKKSDIEILREWCKKQPHLPKITDTEFALFLHYNNYRIEPTKINIDNFYTVRTHVPEFFMNTDPLGNVELRKIFNVMMAAVLKQTTKEGYKIIFGSLLHSDPTDYVFSTGIKYLSMVIDLLLLQEGTNNGIVIVFDAKNVTFGHVARVSPMGLKKCFYYVQEALPVKLRGLHFMNMASAMDAIVNMMKPFLKRELMELLHTHTTMESLKKYIPLDALPNEMCGSTGPIMEFRGSTIKQLEEYRPWLLEDEKRKLVDETLRPEKIKTASDLFGVEGSFKKLDID